MLDLYIVPLNLKCVSTTLTNGRYTLQARGIDLLTRLLTLRTERNQMCLVRRASVT